MASRDGLVKVVIPQATTNLVTNPSAETNLSGYAALAGATIARTTDESRWGRYSIEVTPGVSGDGVQTDPITCASATDVVASCWVRANSNDTLEIVIYDNVTASVKDTQSFSGTDDWQRVEVASDNVAGNDLRVYVRLVSNSSIKFYVDGMQLERWPTEGITAATTYCDGDQAGCTWQGIAHETQTVRDGLERAGGKLLAIDDSDDMLRLFMDGFGMTRYAHLVQPTPLLPGAIIQGVHAEPRVLTMVMQALGDTRAKFHAARAELIDYLKHHATPALEPVLVQYDGTREISAHYDSGLEGMLGRHYKERFPVRFVCYDPYWREVGENTKDLPTGTAFTTNYIVKREDGAWGDMDTGTNGRVRAIVYHPERRTFFAGGEFTEAGSPAVTVNYIAEYDPRTNTWSALGTGMDALVNDLAVAPGGKVYAVGQFTTAGGGSANRIAEWDPSTSTWATLGTGANGELNTVAIGEGNIWVGGLCGTLGGVTVNNVGYWDNQVWQAMDSGTNGRVLSIDVSPDAVAVSGLFTTVGAAATTANRVALWDLSTTAWTTLSTGMNNAVFAVLWEPNTRRLYATGFFTTAGGASINYIARWNGTAWSGLGTGLNDEGATLAWGPDGSLYVGGDFTAVNGDSRIKFVGRWIGGSWVPLDVELPPTSGQRVDAIAFRGKTTIMLGYEKAGTIGASLLITITNAGSARAPARFVYKPTLSLAQPMTANVRVIRNETTGQEIFVNLNPLNNEKVVFDLRSGQKRVYSDQRANLGYAIRPGSAFAEFALAPGDNKVALYYTGTISSVESYVAWRDTYESID